MKYFIYKGNKTGALLIHLFPDHSVHAAVAQQLRVNPISAGFVTPQLICTGESETLGLKADVSRDTFVLRSWFGLTGVAMPTEDSSSLYKQGGPVMSQLYDHIMSPDLITVKSPPNLSKKSSKKKAR